MPVVDELRDLLLGHLKGLEPEFVSPEEVEQPYRRLLCHDHDMTSTLSQFHGGTVLLEVLNEENDENNYTREVILRVGDKTVEYGVIRIFLDCFPEKMGRAILSGARPLGAILNESGLAYESRPVGFLRVDAGAIQADFFPTGDSGFVFGRYNRLLGQDGQVLARIIEFLPTEKP